VVKYEAGAIPYVLAPCYKFSLFDFYNRVTMERIDEYVGELPDHLIPFYELVKSISCFLLKNINEFDIIQRDIYINWLDYFIREIIKLKGKSVSRELILQMVYSSPLEFLLGELVRGYDPRIPFPFENDKGYRGLFEFLEKNLISSSNELCQVKIIEYGWKRGYSWVQTCLLLGVADLESSLRDLQWGDVEFVVTKNSDGTVNLKGKSGLTFINNTLTTQRIYPGEHEKYFDLYPSSCSKDLISGKPAIYFYASEQDRRLSHHPILKIELSKPIDTENLPETIYGFRTGPINGKFGETGPYQIHPSWMYVDAERAALLGTHNYAQYYPHVYRFGEEQMTVASLILNMEECHSVRDYLRCLRYWNRDKRWCEKIVKGAISYYNHEYLKELYTNIDVYLPANYISDSIPRNLPE
jgi:hypothetical protein